MLTSEVAVVKSHHGISVKCSRHRDTGPTDPSLLLIDLGKPYKLPVGSRTSSVDLVPGVKFKLVL